MASEVSASSTVSVGARKILPEEVLLVAAHGSRIDLNQASLEQACPCLAKGANKGGDKAFDGRCACEAGDCFAVFCAAASVWSRCRLWCACCGNVVARGENSCK